MTYKTKVKGPGQLAKRAFWKKQALFVFLTPKKDSTKTETDDFYRKIGNITIISKK